MTALLTRPAPGVPNGLPWKPYRYRGAGTDVLTPWMDEGPEPRVRRSENTRRLLVPCGTPAAYRRHLRHGESPCRACRDAEARRQAGAKAAREAGTP